MALRLAGEETGIQEKVERILYLPGLEDSGDIEPGTKTITAVAKPGSPDYTVSLITDAPSDARLVVTQMAARLQLTIDSMTAGHLYGELHVNGVSRKSFDFTSTGAKLTAIDLSAGQFNVGAANTLEVYLWVDSGDAVVSVCQLWQAVGQQRTNGPFPCLEVHHSGFLQLGFWADRLGSGAITVRGDLRGGDDFNTALVFDVVEHESSNVPSLLLSFGKFSVGTRASADTDVIYVRDVVVVLRSLG